MIYSGMTRWLEGCGVDHQHSGLLVGAVSLANGLVPLFGLWLWQTFGGRWGIFTAGLLLALTGLVPWAIAVGSWPWWSILLRFAFGCGGALLATWMSSVVMQHFESKYFAALAAWNNVSVNIGITLASWVGSGDLVKTPATLLALTGALHLALSFMWLMVCYEPSRVAEPQHSTWGELLQDPTTWLLTVGFSGPLAAYLVLNTWLPTHLIRLGIAPSLAQESVFYLNLAGLPAAPMGSWLYGRGLRLTYLLSVCGLGLPCTLTLLVLGFGPTFLWAALSGFLLLLYVGPFFALPMLLAHSTPQSVAGQVGAIMAGSYLATCWLPAFIGSQLDSRQDITLVLLILAVGCASLLIANLIQCDYNSASPAAADS